ncbi:MAG: hypothetical protein KC547_12990 [Anaerolineae bacterium]|nr:hypothetical protein [Anaerolineae bacterium]MCA9907996.1 hypothetical protein [Anaerolineae bacterium]
MTSSAATDVEQIIGFDAREMWMDDEAHWPRERREQFLLRPTVKKPLSTDHIVWPSIFHNVSDDETAIHYPPPSWTHLSELRSDLASLNLLRSHWIIAITCIGDRGWYEDVYPKIVDQNWTLLGYDISDHSLLSGLMNCGYTEEDQNLESIWRDKLNAHHLFMDRSDAARFRAVTDDRVREHGPFFVYGLYLIEDKQINK